MTRRGAGILKRFLIGAAALSFVIYGGDFLSLQLRIPSREQFGSVEIKRYFIVKLKNRKTGFMPDEPQTVSCVNSLFPQWGFAPCWWVTRHKVQEIEIDAGRPGPIINTP
jgi:hypothetical protein